MKQNFRLLRPVVAGAVSALVSGALCAPVAFAQAHDREVSPYGHQSVGGEILPTGMRITPTAARGALFRYLNPDLPTRPDYLAGSAVDAIASPDGNTLLILTSGYNRNNDVGGRRIADESDEYVFVYDIRNDVPVKQQVIRVPNTFNGIAWNPNGKEFYVSGGVNDNVHIFRMHGGMWVEDGVVALGHGAGLGLGVRPMAAGVAVNSAGNRLLVANYENDSVTLVGLDSRAVLAEQDLRPGKIDPAQSGVPGGSYPFGVVFSGEHTAYVSSQRDREIIVLDVRGDAVAVVKRIPVRGQPNKMIVNRAGTRLYAAIDNSDSVVVVDTGSNTVREEIPTLAPRSVFPNPEGFKGANPNALALSPDEGTLFVTNGGSNSVAVIQLAHALADKEDEGGDGKLHSRGAQADDNDGAKQLKRSRVIGLIPTGWYPNSVSVSRDGGMLYVVNGKSNAGPNPEGCRDTVSIQSGSLDTCRGKNQYVWQLQKAGFLSIPMPRARELARLTWQVAKNNNFPVSRERERWNNTMAFLRSRIKHVVYIVKENRTYDQVLGDLDRGNGDPGLAILGPYSPNHHRLAKQFATLDNFYDSGETSNTGWNWTTAARTTDFTEKTAPVNYAGRGLTYDWEGDNRNINVAYPTVEARQAANPLTPSDPDLLAGTADVAAPDGPEGEAGAGYLWDAALRAGLSVRNYGFYGDLGRYFLPPSHPDFIALSRNPYVEGVVQFYPTKQSLMKVSDPYFRGYDMKYPDFWRFKEWEREFDQYVAQGKLPRLSLVRFPHDHFGSFSTAIDGVNTVEAQMADNDYAVGLIVQKIAHSPFRDNTLIFVIEDDAQNGADHVDAHRSIAYVIGPYTKRGALVSKHYTTVSMLRTMEEILGIEPLGINDGLAVPMADVFDREQRRWDYKAAVPAVLYTTDLPLPAPAGPMTAAARVTTSCGARPLRSAAYWAEQMRGQNFTAEDHLDEPRFNRALWAGLKGDATAYPLARDGRDLRRNRKELLQRYRASLKERCEQRVFVR